MLAAKLGCRYATTRALHAARRRGGPGHRGARAAARAYGRIGVLMSATPDDPYQTTYLSAFMQGLQERGWTIGRNVRIDPRWGAGNTDSFGSMQRSWSRSRRMLSWRRPARLWAR